MSSAVTGRGRAGASRLTPWSRNQVWASPPMVSSNTRCVASIMLDIAVAPTWSAMAFDCSMTAFTAATLASIGPLPALVVTRGERESRSDSLQVGGGDDLFGWLDDLGHGLIVGERVRGIIPGIRRTRGMGFVHHQRTSC